MRGLRRAFGAAGWSACAMGIALAAQACSDSVSSGSGSGAGGSGSEQGGAGTNASSSASASGSSSGASSSVGGFTSAASGTGGEPVELPTSGPCLEGQCADGYFCEFELHACGAYPPSSDSCDPDQGQCHQIGASCEGTEPVCGCDGQVHASACAAQRAGVDTAAWSCEAADGAPGSFPCGMFFCDAATEFCSRGNGDSCDNYFACKPLDPQCPAPPDAACPTCFEPDACANGNACSCAETQGNGAAGITVGYGLPLP